MAKRAQNTASISGPALASTAAASRLPWSPNDQGTVVTRATLRELRLRMTLGLPVDTDFVADVLDLAEDVLLAADKAARASQDVDACGTLGEVSDLIEALEKARAQAVEDGEKESRDLKKEISDLQDAKAESERDLAATADEWRKQAERAEHDLAASVRNGSALDREAAERVKAAEQAVRVLAEIRRLLAGGTTTSED